MLTLPGAGVDDVGERAGGGQPFQRLAEPLPPLVLIGRRHLIQQQDEPGRAAERSRQSSGKSMCPWREMVVSSSIARMLGLLLGGALPAVS